MNMRFALRAKCMSRARWLCRRTRGRIPHFALSLAWHSLTVINEKPKMSASEADTPIAKSWATFHILRCLQTYVERWVCGSKPIFGQTTRGAQDNGLCSIPFSVFDYSADLACVPTRPRIQGRGKPPGSSVQRRGNVSAVCRRPSGRPSTQRVGESARTIGATLVQATLWQSCCAA